MKRKLFTYSLGALSLLFSTVAYAQSSQANVPFAFTAANTELPAGNYFIQQKADSKFISIVDSKTGKAVFAFASEQQTLPYNAPAKLVFHRYGNQHFLAEVWPGGGGTAATFSPTALEKQSRAHLVASNPKDNAIQQMAAMK